MTEYPWSADDERLLDLLGGIAQQVDPAPPLAYELGHETFALHRIDDELAELVADSLLDAHAVRATASDVRLLSFQGPGLIVEVQVSHADARYSVIGVLERSASGDGGRAYLETPDGASSSVLIDADDRFEFEDVRQSLVRFRIAIQGHVDVTTAWVRL